MTSGVDADSESDLRVALSAVAETGRVIAAADTKAGLVVAAEGVMLAATATLLRLDRLPPSTTAVAVAVVLLAVLALLCLVTCIWPRLRGHPSYLALTTLADGHRQPVRTVEAFAENGWAQARTLANIARCKHHWFRAALVPATTGWILFAALVVIVATSI